MEYDYSSIRDAIKKIMKFAEEITELVTTAWNTIRPYAKEILEFMQLLERKTSKKKTIYNPIRNIRPNKAIMLSKRTNVYYCRNNC